MKSRVASLFCWHSNMYVKYRFVPYLISKLPTTMLTKWKQSRLMILYYHMVSDDEVAHVRNLYPYKTVRMFKEDIEYILKHYDPLTLFDLIDILKNGQSVPEKSFLLTFDDGFREMHDIICPILSEKGIPATFFINSGFIDNQELCYLNKMSLLVEYLRGNNFINLENEILNLFRKTASQPRDALSCILSVKYRQRVVLEDVAKIAGVDFESYLVKHKPYLTSDQIRSMIKRGFAIGAHSIDHPLYSTLTLNEQLFQTIESTRKIREIFGLKYGAFAFPHSDLNVSQKFFEELSETGLVDVTFGTYGMTDDVIPSNFQRISLERPFAPAEQIIAFHYARRFYKQLTGSGKIKR